MKSHPDPFRRQFLQSGAVVTGGLLIASCGKVPAEARTNGPENAPVEPKPAELSQPQAKPQPKMTYGTLLTGGSQINVKSGEKRWVFSQLNLDKAIAAFPEGARDPLKMIAWAQENARLIVEFGFLAHGVIPNPFKPERLLVFEKKGSGGCEIDLKENKVVTKIEPSKGCEFYGHGGYSADGKQVYATEYDATTYEGRMVVRDAGDFKVLGEFPTHGDWPHDCQFIDGGKTVAVTNGGGHLQGGSKPNVSFVEVGGGKLLDKIEFSNPNINAGHLFLTPEKDLAVLHAMREGLDTKEALGALSLRPAGKKFITMERPVDIANAMKGETLSAAWYQQDGIVGVTNPYGNLVTFWNMAKQEYVGRLRVKQPRGIALTLDRKYFAVTFDKESPTLVMVPAASRTPDKEPMQFPLPCDGSHAYVYDHAV